MRRCMLACTFVALLTSAAYAATLNQQLRFSYSRPSTGSIVLESGPGSSFPHPYYQVISAGLSPFSAAHTSTLNVTYEPQLAAPGTTIVGIRMVNPSASFRETFGTSATVGLGRNPFDNSKSLVSASVGLSVDLRGSGQGYMGSSIKDTDVGLAQPAPSLGIPFVLEAVASPSISATSELGFAALVGQVRYRNRETGVSGVRPLNLTGIFQPIHLDLTERGIYDVSIINPVLGAGMTSTRSFGVSFNVDVFGSGVINPPPTIQLSSPTQNFSTIPFQLNSSDRNGLVNWFTIEVVPEPSTWAMCCMVLPVAWVFLRRSRAVTGRRRRVS